MKKRSVKFGKNTLLPILLLAACLMNSARGQGTSGNQDPTHDHGAATSTAIAAEVEAEDHSTHQTMVMQSGSGDSSSLRDPHANSGGYTLSSGPYLLAGPHAGHATEEMRFQGVWIDRFEQTAGNGPDQTRIAGNYWYGTSYDRLLINVEAERVGGALHDAKAELLWSHAIHPFWDVQTGVRHDSGEGPSRSWLAAGIQGLAPYWFEIDATAYLGEGGNTALKFEVDYELLLTQQLILQPRIEMNFYGKTDAARGRGEGLSDVSTGLRLRYEFSRQFAPYLGYEWIGRFGETADLLTDVKAKESFWVVGLHFWF